jgi:hypothetical protein
MPQEASPYVLKGVNPLSIALADDGARGHSYPFVVLDGDGDMILETEEDRLSKHTLISP